MADAHGVDFAGDAIVHVRDEVSITLLLQVEIFNVNTVGGKVSVKLGLFWELALVDFLRPKGVLAEVLPVNTLNWVFFKESSQQIVEDRGETLYFGGF